MDYSSKAKSSNVHNFLLLISTVNGARGGARDDRIPSRAGQVRIRIRSDMISDPRAPNFLILIMQGFTI